MKQEFVKKLDELGRVVIPSEIRTELDWKAGEKISVLKLKDGIILGLYKNKCLVCRSEENITQIHNKFICKKCIDKISEIAREK